MIKDKLLLDDLILSRQYSTSQVSILADVSRATVNRRIKYLGVGKGRGVKHLWVYDDMTTNLAYVIGAFITDGSLSREYQTRKIRGLQFHVVDNEFADHYEKCLRSIGLPANRYIVPISGKMKQIQQGILCSSSAFARWISDQTGIHKDRIPDCIIGANTECKNAFLAGVIDGDGHVTNKGCIRVRSTMQWIHDLPKVVEALGIRATQNTGKAPNGKDYYMVSIHRGDFIKNSGHCFINRKLHRIYRSE
jgi:DNA-binding transcriptional regulator WhiA